MQETQAARPHAGQRATLAQWYELVRAESRRRADPLSPEDQSLQSMPDASPTKWHLAHTSWFFEAVVLQPHQPGYRVFDARWHHLFNSYYEALGPRHARAQRGVLSRPSLAAVLEYRAHVDAAMRQLITQADATTWALAAPLVTLGLHHEQQHQELMLTDILHAFWCNPLLPAYRPRAQPLPAAVPGDMAMQWIDVPGGPVAVGHSGKGFAFDNETPRHTVQVAPCQMASRLVTCGEYARFIADGGYNRASLWLSDGWAAVQAQGWQAPAYWLAPQDPRAPAAHWQQFGLNGVQALDAGAAVTQLSFYEAAAYAQWAGARLPTEFEWEAACEMPGMVQQHGVAWQWTRSSYDPYPGFRPLAGAVGEYNGKFMVGQLVLRGSSQATPKGHARATYRNFFPPAARWQFSGLRLARDSSC